MRKKDYIVFRYRPNKSKVNGFFDEDDKNIYINEDLNMVHRELVYIHENQHRDCFIHKCKCWNRSIFLCEYHAFRAELKFLLEKDNSKYWKTYFVITIKSLIKFGTNINNIWGWEEHFKALRKVCNLKDFKKVASKYGYWLLIKSIVNND
jgi:hypothetical protein